MRVVNATSHNFRPSLISAVRAVEVVWRQSVMRMSIAVDVIAVGSAQSRSPMSITPMQSPPRLAHSQPFSSLLYAYYRNGECSRQGCSL